MSTIGTTILLTLSIGMLYLVFRLTREPIQPTDTTNEDSPPLGLKAEPETESAIGKTVRIDGKLLIVGLDIPEEDYLSWKRSLTVDNHANCRRTFEWGELNGVKVRIGIDVDRNGYYAAKKKELNGWKKEYRPIGIAESAMCHTSSDTLGD